MNKLGWSILILICLVGGGFVSMMTFGGPANGPVTNAVAPVVAKAKAIRIDMSGYPQLAVPVVGVPRQAIQDNWGDPRDNGLRAHHGTDILAPGGTLVTAAAPGMVEKLFESKDGGTTLYVRSPHRNWQYYYAHLSGYAPGVREGLAVKVGDPLGYVGDTGNAGAGNYHLHFGLTRMRPGDRWWEGEPVNAYPLLAGKAPGG